MIGIIKIDFGAAGECRLASLKSVVQSCFKITYNSSSSGIDKSFREDMK